MKRALITGVTGQDGTYLARFLLSKGYRVWGMERRCSTRHRSNLVEERHPDYQTVYGDLSDLGSLIDVVRKAQPDEVYNLAAQSNVQTSWSQQSYTMDVTGAGAVRLMECCRRYSPSVRFYQASSSEMFGNVPFDVNRQAINENHPMSPCNPYGAAKLYAHNMARMYRERGMFVACGILFNHESPLRSPEFVTRKITKGIARIAYGLQRSLHLGNANGERDWGFAGDYVEAMWRMLNTQTPDDFVVATGNSYTVRHFAETAASHFSDKMITHVYYGDPKHERPVELQALRGDATKIRNKLGWKPKTTFKELVRMMVEHDCEEAKAEQTVQRMTSESWRREHQADTPPTEEGAADHHYTNQDPDLKG